jgi:hypothetical protein
MEVWPRSLAGAVPQRVERRWESLILGIVRPLRGAAGAVHSREAVGGGSNATEAASVGGLFLLGL